MRILYLSPEIPDPTSGGRIRIYQQLSHLAKSHEVHVMILTSDSNRPIPSDISAMCESFFVQSIDDRPIAKASRYVQSLLRGRPWMSMKYHMPLFTRRVSEMATRLQPDVVIAAQFYLAGHIPSGPWRKLVDRHDVEWSSYRTAVEANPWSVHGLHAFVQMRIMSRFEPQLAARVEAEMVTSHLDADRLKTLAPTAEVVVVPNGVDCSQLIPGRFQRADRTVVFVGSMRYRPNVDGSTYLVKQVMPLVWEREPDAVCWIVGGDPPPSVTALESERVKVLGLVPDVGEYVGRATVSVVPIFQGGGTRLKALEAMAAGTPIVTTTLGVEGLLVQDGQHVMIGDTPDQLADDIIELFNSPELREDLASQALSLVRGNFDWHVCLRPLDALLGGMEPDACWN